MSKPDSLGITRELPSQFSTTHVTLPNQGGGLTPKMVTLEEDKFAVQMHGQVPDEPDLLRLMLKDTASAADVYKPTNYWANYEIRTLRELSKAGLRNFRRRKNSTLSSFGATDFLPPFGISLFRNRLFNNRATRRIPFWSKILSICNVWLNRIFPSSIPYDATVEDIRYLAYYFARSRGKESDAKSINEFEASLIGNPEDLIEVDGKVYTMSSLNCYLRYAYCCNFLDFEKIRIIVELGSGSGNQVEVLKKLHPKLSFFLFDIPPQLYVCEQYLKSLFPDSVVSYRDTREMFAPPPIQEGKIYLFGNWKFPILSEVEIDLFWNAASFQEMEPDVVSNYLKYVNDHAKTAFLLELMVGKELAKKKGSHGVLRQTKLDDYKRGLSNFQLIDMSPHQFLPKLTSKQNYNVCFWKRIEEK